MEVEELLQQAQQLFWQGKFSDALYLLEKIEIKDQVTEIEYLYGQLLQCRIIATQDVRKAQDLTDHILQTTQSLNHPLIQVDALLIVAEAWIELGRLDIGLDLVERAKMTLESHPDVSVAERTTRNATALALECASYAYKGLLERAFECGKESLKLSEQLEDSRAIATALTYLSGAFYWSGDPDRTFALIQQGLSLCKQLKIPQAIAPSFYRLGRVHYWRGDLNPALEVFKKCLELYESLGIQYGIASALNWFGQVYAHKGELEHALDLCQQCLQICEQLDIPDTFAESRALMTIGGAHMTKGDLKSALVYFQRSLAIEEVRGGKPQMGNILALMGEIYRAQGHLETALEYGMKGLKIWEDIAADERIVACLANVINITLERGQLEPATHYLHHLEGISNQSNNPAVEPWVRLARALVLKTSTRTRDKMRAQDLFQQLVNNQTLPFQEWIRASLHLCELLFFEFKTSDNPAILSEIHTITDRLLNLAKEQFAYSILSESYLLQAKLALLELNVPQARQLLTQAQKIAEDKELERLAQRISHEHDALLTQLPQWEALRSQKTPLQKARELSDIEDMLIQLARQRAIDPPELHPEIPVLFMLLTEEGLTRFSYPFEYGQRLEEHLIGGFLTALAAFGQDAFVETGRIDRITYQNYTIAVKPLTPLMVCYIFQGQSYLPLQKMEQFLTQIRAMPKLHQTLTTMPPVDAAAKAVTTLDSKAKTGLEQLITEIF